MSQHNLQGNTKEKAINFRFFVQLTRGDHGATLKKN